MAARVHKIRHDDETRAKIQAAQIINRFTKCVNGEIELTAQQVSCGKTLLDKVLPDLKATELTGEGGGPIGIHTKSDRDAILAAVLRANS